MPEPSALLRRLVPYHVGALLVFTTWAFGGQAPWARQVITAWGTAGIALFLACSLVHRDRGGRLHPVWRLLWPLWVFDVLVAISCFNPGFRETMVAGETMLVQISPIAWLPSAALPRLAARELWQFNGLLLSAFNLIYALDRRSTVRALLFLSTGNAVLLAVLGSFQKLIGAKGLWFGTVPSPNSRFFATFIYHNHWGAFVLLNIAACLALLFHYHRRGDHRDTWHSPVLFGAVVTLLLAASVPLSASRSCTVLVAALLGVALLHFTVRVVRERRRVGASITRPLAGLLAAALLAALAVAFLGRGSMGERIQQTTRQLANLGDGEVVTSRLTLYRDTWQMAEAKPWFGWGLESYAHVFRIFNTQRAAETWVWIPFYAEAHNDWLQAVAEVGLVGTGLLLLQGLLLTRTADWRRSRSLIPRYLLAGCGLLLAYAWLEFPFANPAVLLTFCTFFFCAVRYAALESSPSTANAHHG